MMLPEAVLPLPLQSLWDGPSNGLLGGVIEWTVVIEAFLNTEGVVDNLSQWAKRLVVQEALEMIFFQ